MATPGTLFLNASTPPTQTGPNPVIPPAGTGNPWFNSPYRIITYAMRDAGYLGDLQEPSSEDYAVYLSRLNDLVNLWQTQGLKLWLQQDVSFATVAGQYLYQIGPGCTNTVDGTFFTWPKPPRILEAYWQYSTGVRYPLITMSRQEFDQLSTLVQQGNINSYFIDKQQYFTGIWLWLTPSSAFAASGAVHVLLQAQINNLITLTDQANFPLEWFMALHWGLADEISQGQPVAVQQKCSTRAETFRNALENWDVEDASTNFQPDQRTQYQQSKFI